MPLLAILGLHNLAEKTVQRKCLSITRLLHVESIQTIVDKITRNVCLSASFWKMVFRSLITSAGNIIQGPGILYAGRMCHNDAMAHRRQLVNSNGLTLSYADDKFLPMPQGHLLMILPHLQIQFCCVQEQSR